MKSSKHGTTFLTIRVWVAMVAWHGDTVLAIMVQIRKCCKRSNSRGLLLNLIEKVNKIKLQQTVFSQLTLGNFKGDLSWRQPAEFSFISRVFQKDSRTSLKDILKRLNRICESDLKSQFKSYTLKTK